MADINTIGHKKIITNFMVDCLILENFDLYKFIKEDGYNLSYKDITNIISRVWQYVDDINSKNYIDDIKEKYTIIHYLHDELFKNYEPMNAENININFSDILFLIDKYYFKFIL